METAGVCCCGEVVVGKTNKQLLKNVISKAVEHSKEPCTSCISFLPIEKAPNGSVICFICKKLWNYRSDLARHIMSIHIKPKLAPKCESCGIVYNGCSSKELLGKIVENSPDNKEPCRKCVNMLMQWTTEDDLPICFVCQEEFPCKLIVKEHIIDVHVSFKQNTAEQFKKKRKRSEYAEKSDRKELLESPRKCDEVYNMSMSKEQLFDKIVLKSSDGRKPCIECVNNLVLYDSVNRLASCFICKKVYKYKSDAARHIDVHVRQKVREMKRKSLVHNKDAVRIVVAENTLESNADSGEPCESSIDNGEQQELSSCETIVNLPNETDIMENSVPSSPYSSSSCAFEQSGATCNSTENYPNKSIRKITETEQNRIGRNVLSLNKLPNGSEKCNKCGQIFENWFSNEDVVQIIVKNSMSSKEPCIGCISKLIKRKQEDDTLLACAICGKPEKCQLKLASHIISVHINIKLIENCELCGLVYTGCSSKELLEKILKTSSNDKQHCNICLNRLMNWSTETDFLTCFVCKEKFLCKTVIRRHVLDVHIRFQQDSIELYKEEQQIVSSVKIERQMKLTEAHENCETCRENLNVTLSKVQLLEKIVRRYFDGRELCSKCVDNVVMSDSESHLASCFICNKVCENKLEADRHIEVHIRQMVNNEIQRSKYGVICNEDETEKVAPENTSTDTISVSDKCDATSIYDTVHQESSNYGTVVSFSSLNCNIEDPVVSNHAIGEHVPVPPYAVENSDETVTEDGPNTSKRSKATPSLKRRISRNITNLQRLPNDTERCNRCGQLYENSLSSVEVIQIIVKNSMSSKTPCTGCVNKLIKYKQEDDTLACVICGKSEEYRSNLARHIISIHINIKLIKNCARCGAVHNGCSSSELWEKVQIGSKKNNGQPCIACVRTFIRWTTDNGTLSCFLCNTQFNDKTRLFSHIKHHLSSN